MAGIRGTNGSGNPASHFGRQIRKERMRRGWTTRDLARETGLDPGHLSRIENGRRPPTEKIAIACDEAFPERHGWFLEYYSEMRGWSEVPAAFRDYAELEERAAVLSVWTPSIMHGLLQAEPYARALLSTYPGVTPEMVDSRLAARLERQKRVLFRDKPPLVTILVDEVALYRVVGSAEVMAAQLDHVLSVAALPHVTLQVLPLVAHCANASGLILVDQNAAYAEHLAAGFTYTDAQTVAEMTARFNTVRGECYRVSETLTLVEKMRDVWATGVSPASAMRTAETA